MSRNRDWFKVTLIFKYLTPATVTGRQPLFETSAAALYERLVTCVFFHIYEIQRLWRGRGVRCHVEACQGGQLVPHEQVN